MSIYRLTRLLRHGEIMDARHADRSPRLRKVAVALAIAAIVFFVGWKIGSPNAGWLLLFAIIFGGVSLLCSALYCLAAKLYGRLAVATVVFFFGSCGLLISTTHRSAEPSPPAALAQQAVSKSGPPDDLARTPERHSTTAVGAAESALLPPSTPRTIQNRVAMMPGVYLDTKRKVAHKAACPQRGNARRALVSVAKMRGYAMHDACMNLADETEYETVESVSPEWVEYEKKVFAEEGTSRAHRNVGTAQSLVSAAPKPPDSGTAAPVADETVSYNKKSRTYHCLACASALKCKNCVHISRTEAERRGGVRCGSCGISC